MASAAEQPAAKPGSGFMTEEQRRAAESVRTQKARRKQELNLQRENILSQRTSSPARRSALEAALKHIEQQIESLG